MKKAITALNKYVTRSFTAEQIDNMAFFEDTENAHGYTWNAEVDGVRIELTYNYATGKINELRIA